MTYAYQESVSLLSAGAVLQCLRLHRTELTAECRKEELKLNIIQSRDVRLQPSLHKQCSEEIAVFCSDVESGNNADLCCLCCLCCLRTAIS